MTATALRITPDSLLKPRRVIIGTSVTRLAAAQIHAHIPYSIVDGVDNAAFGGSYYQPDGRGMYTVPSHGGKTLWQGLQDEIARKVLRAGNVNRDWVVMEYSRGVEDLEQAEPYLDRIVDACLQNGLRLAWVLPHVYYLENQGTKTAAQIAWNDELREMMVDRVARVPGSVLIDWDYLVAAWTAITPSLTPAQVAVDQPLTYDGRHPTGSTAYPGPGCERLAAAMQAATGL